MFGLPGLRPGLRLPVRAAGGSGWRRGVPGGAAAASPRPGCEHRPGPGAWRRGAQGALPSGACGRALGAGKFHVFKELLSGECVCSSAMLHSLFLSFASSHLVLLLFFFFVSLPPQKKPQNIQQNPKFYHDSLSHTTPLSGAEGGG